MSLKCGLEFGLLDWDAVLGRVGCQRETEGGQEKLVVLGCLLLGEVVSPSLVQTHTSLEKK